MLFLPVIPAWWKIVSIKQRPGDGRSERLAQVLNSDACKQVTMAPMSFGDTRHACCEICFALTGRFWRRKISCPRGRGLVENHGDQAPAQ